MAVLVRNSLFLVLGVFGDFLLSTMIAHFMRTFYTGWRSMIRGLVETKWLVLMSYDWLHGPGSAPDVARSGYRASQSTIVECCPVSMLFSGHAGAPQPPAPLPSPSPPDITPDRKSGSLCIIERLLFTVHQTASLEALGKSKKKVLEDSRSIP
ncbi:hypothetical protein K432DRAFT_93805 [Lepidopterella palustris CBS 459.81]|uniref:Uncharacterized protein n=1 Tax=Lepidopterella palustris CBS 459.81 TaxID=1314670 RepID=A0A8E2JDA0_9PEZI|nr:hypothetical protein K432DRAFT_93805 [Lepidopterella palustris CBS 459.81]